MGKTDKIDTVEKGLLDIWDIDTDQTIGLIFDIDELLYDNKVEIFLAYKSVIDSRGIQIKEDETFPGKDLFDIVYGIRNRYDILDNVEVLIDERRTRYIELLKESDSNLKDGVVEIFGFLHNNKHKLNIRTAYATSSEKAFTEIILEKIFEQCNRDHGVSNPDDFFYTNNNNQICSTCWETGLAKKPNPMLYAMTVEKMGLIPQQCIAVEDSPSGTKAALAAGLNVIVVPSVSMEEIYKEITANTANMKRIYELGSLLDFLPLLASLADNE